MRKKAQGFYMNTQIEQAIESSTFYYTTVQGTICSSGVTNMSSAGMGKRKVGVEWVGKRKAEEIA